MTRRTPLLLLAATALAVMVGTANAADVLFVDSEVPDTSWQTLIEDGGNNTYTLFDTSTYHISLNNQDSIDYVNSFDLIVISGSNPVFNAIRAYGATWNAQPTPMITMGNYLCSGQFSSASWRWTDATSKANNSSGVVDVLEPADPVWEGVTLTSGTPPDPDTADLLDAGAGHLNLNGTNLLPGITAVAVQSSNDQYVTIAYAEAEALRAGGAPQYFIAGMTGGSGNPVVFSDDGKLVFLNAITALTGGPAGLTGDMTGDGVVDAADYIILKQNFGTASGATLETGDIAKADGTPGQDGAVDINDLNLLAANIGTVGAGAVPEPATLGLLGLGALAVLRKRRAA